ncbi:hypothetical protein Patl1_19521 [Pistacia atlantica]|uniref:Uncharacterized protein n=1 Tax=Pistacia atlantica TaxID=434234 RepID=A0ACC1BX40_9ROSI|nr:hypothetical protein Patl1_19521 [Pistacia atlantica]
MSTCRGIARSSSLLHLLVAQPDHLNCFCEYKEDTMMMSFLESISIKPFSFLLNATSRTSNANLIY